MSFSFFLEGVSVGWERSGCVGIYMCSESKGEIERREKRKGNILELSKSEIWEVRK